MIGKTVFVVSADYGYEGLGDPLSVWTTRRKAEKEVKRLQEAKTYFQEYVVNALVLS